MLHVISTAAICQKFKDCLKIKLKIQHWVVTKSLPNNVNQINRFLEKNSIQKGHCLLLIPLKGKDFTALPMISNLGVVVSYFFYQKHMDIHRWIEILNVPTQQKTREALILSMMKPFYKKWANRLTRFFNQREGRYKSVNLLPERTTKEELASRLSKGGSLAIYLGHGRSRGWSGYRGFRWKHMEACFQGRPLGALISFSCSSLKQDKLESLPFGLEWTKNGRSACFFGATGEVKIKSLITITNLFMECLTKQHPVQIGDLIKQMHFKILDLKDEKLLETWDMFKLLGNPCVEI